MKPRLPGMLVPLIAAKSKSLVGYLDYRREDLSNTQARLSGRYSIRPVLDFERFKARAVIDWITLRVTLDRNTQFQWLQREIEPIGGRRSYVENVDGDNTASSNCFDIRFQEPEIATVLKSIAAVRAKFGLALEPSVRGIEISVDFIPKTPDDLLRARMVRVLMNHLQVRPDVTTNVRDRPRTVWGRGPDFTQRLLYDSRHLTPAENEQFLLETDRDRAPNVDGTLEVGEKEASVRWRVMDKVIDTQNISAGTFVLLDEKSKRARVEVTLAHPETENIGIGSLNDLRTFSFTKLQGKYFQFALPTFAAEPVRASKRQALAAASNPERAAKFSKTGVIGLKAMDATRDDARRNLRRRVMHHIHASGLRMSVLNRNAQGATSTFVAFEDLNQRVRVALRNLGKRVGDGFSSAP
ncbi:hypothetical protein L905_06075 [Agrobacterium sp. TS43]|uniref:hypothetical protein n=1 Tax=Agrobacterium TaxID=357 RepID=UPI0003FC0106|nr:MULTISPECIES: hypothetical protein [Agrobacterium]KVK57567.1 hypothetical protein L906_27155 [Agrobacterium sp. TS45]KVK60849.1 hypothetical protein L907_27030 [Agrobacterium sp. C13]KVK61546.1 hypothetical protein L905_06075 [Agrobacterium sp. TS43]